MDINTKKLKKNAFRVTKVRGITAARIRVPGGYLNAKYLEAIKTIAQTYGDGTIHITSRQGFEIMGIPFEQMERVNKVIQELIDGMEINQEAFDQGYPASGTRNISACIGNKVCPYACYNTTKFAKKIEKAVFPNDLHFKIGLTGCPNDCAKARMNDFGIIGMTLPQFDKNRCVSCGACVRMCAKKSVKALEGINYRPVRNHEKCIGCGECIVNCPTMAWTRSEKKYYKLSLLGRTGKKNPRLGEDFIKWADEDSILKIILNTYDYVGKYIDLNAAGGKEHIGYIVDRTGFEVYKEWALKGVTLPEESQIYSPIYWSGLHF
ncbi:sulfite reductase subunit C [Candidatus Epulonipiscium viviparus]|uniref:sulfite reductase subunit C n=1 Tax=Candidatus Epulonipiscium viviparus TaxID=420336 RepID=UPI00016C0C7B|nr:sulfite reductase subunit C [Candidatus Epulopiscium viviparus]